MTSDNQFIGYLDTVDRKSASKQAYLQLRTAILQGRFSPESRLIETSIAKSLNVSRTPVREAFSKLERDGLVRRLDSGGVVVVDNSSKLSEIVIIRQCLEGAAVRLACARSTDQELEELVEASHEAAQIAANASAAIRYNLDREFHLKLGRLSGSPRLTRLIEEFYEYFLAFRLPRGGKENLLLQRQHLIIVDAIASRDPDKAENAMRDHLGTVMGMLGKMIHSLE
jgi:DNA-binding GntR family transcriptional regulator